MTENPSAYESAIEKLNENVDVSDLGYFDRTDLEEKMTTVLDGTRPLSDEEDIIDAEKALYGNQNSVLNEQASSVVKEIIDVFPFAREIAEWKEENGYDPDKPLKHQVRDETYQEWFEEKDKEWEEDTMPGETEIGKAHNETIEEKRKAAENRDESAVKQYNREKSLVRKYDKKKGEWFLISFEKKKGS